MAGNLFWLNETFYNNLLHYGATKLEAGGGGVKLCRPGRTR